MNIAIFVSGNGTNCENIIRHFNYGSTPHKVALVVSNRADAFALTRAEHLAVPSVVLSKTQLNSERSLMSILRVYSIDFIALAGYMLMIPDFLIDAFPQRIVNIHPSLLPKYGGKGMWGHHVHEAVKAAGETETGITIHYVSRECDGGAIIAQFKTPLSPTDSAADIEAKVHELERLHYAPTIEKLLSSF